MPKIRHTSYWLDRFPKTRQPSYPRHRGTLDTSVAIVGGGATGCMTAYAFAAAGVKVALFEADRLGHRTTGATTALLMQEPEPDFQDLAGTHGLRVARRAWDMMRRATLDLAATVKRLRLQCGLEPRDSIYFTVVPDEMKRLRREYDARREAGLEATWLNRERLRAATRIEGVAGIRQRGNGQLDPYRATLGFAAAAIERGAAVYERSPVVRIRPRRRLVEIRTRHGLVRADRVIIATDYPTPLFQPLVRHFKIFETYVVVTPPLGAKVRAGLGARDAMLWDTETPYHYLRGTRDDRIMFGGADQPHRRGPRSEKVLVQRGGQLMYELSKLYPVISGIQPEYAWSELVSYTADGLPYIGPHRNYPRHLFALGYGGNGLASAFLASRILLREYLGEPAKGDEVFAFTRVRS